MVGFKSCFYITCYILNCDRQLREKSTFYQETQQARLFSKPIFSRYVLFGTQLYRLLIWHFV